MACSLSSTILLLTNLCLTALSIYWAVSSWSALTEARTEKHWLSSSCNIVKVSVFPLQPVILNPSNDKGVFCPILTVNITTVPANITLPFSVVNVTIINSASFFPPQRNRLLSSIRNDLQLDPSVHKEPATVEPARLDCATDQSSVETELSDLKPGLLVRCWISPPPYDDTLLSSSDNQNNPRVSLWEVPTGVRPRHINLVVISTILAAAAILSMTAITYLIYIPHPPGSFISRDNAQFLPIFTASTPGPTRAYGGRVALSTAAVDAILSIAEQNYADWSGELGNMETADRTCPICLEEGLGARLECNHAFHSHCIRRWLARGGQTCPLCCVIVKPPVHLVMQSSSSSTSTDTSTTGGQRPTGNYAGDRLLRNEDEDEDFAELLHLPPMAMYNEMSHSSLALLRNELEGHAEIIGGQQEDREEQRTASTSQGVSPLADLTTVPRNPLIRRTYTFARLPVPYGSTMIQLGPSRDRSNTSFSPHETRAARTAPQLRRPRETLHESSEVENDGWLLQLWERVHQTRTGDEDAENDADESSEVGVGGHDELDDDILRGLGVVARIIDSNDRDEDEDGEANGAANNEATNNNGSSET